MAQQAAVCCSVPQQPEISQMWILWRQTSPLVPQIFVVFAFPLFFFLFTHMTAKCHKVSLIICRQP